MQFCIKAVSGEGGGGGGGVGAKLAFVGMGRHITGS